MPNKKKAEGAGAAAKKAPAKKRAPSAKKPSKEPVAAPAAGRLRIKQVRSGIGHAATYRRTLEALGLKHHQDEVLLRDHPSIRGMLRKVWHLVSVQAVEG